MIAENRGQDVADEALDQGPLLDDRDRMSFTDPRHRPIHPIPFATRAEEDRVLAGNQQSAVEGGGFAGDELWTKIGQVANVFVLPDEQGLKPGLFPLRLRPGHPLAAQFRQVNTIFVAGLELSTREAAHEVLSRPSVLRAKTRSS